MTVVAPTAIIADDEPLLREALGEFLAAAWPELQVVAYARNGSEAVDLFEDKRPAICFLDVQMPGLSGIEAARHIGARAHLVFVTAYDEYAVEAFRQGVLDYLVKPVEPARLAETVSRLRQRLLESEPALNTDKLLQQLLASWHKPDTTTALRWIRASVGNTVRLIPVDEVVCLRAEDKYTVVAWTGDGGREGEAVIRTPLKELAAQLDTASFAQIHRAFVVSLRAIDHVKRHANETAEIHLKSRTEVLPVSRNYLHHFKQI